MAQRLGPCLKGWSPKVSLGSQNRSPELFCAYLLIMFISIAT